MICNIDNHVPGSQGGILFGNLGAQYDNMVTCTLCGSYHTARQANIKARLKRDEM